MVWEQGAEGLGQGAGSKGSGSSKHRGWEQQAQGLVKGRESESIGRKMEKVWEEKGAQEGEGVRVWEQRARWWE